MARSFRVFVGNWIEAQCFYELLTNIENATMVRNPVNDLKSMREFPFQGLDGMQSW